MQYSKIGTPFHILKRSDGIIFEARINKASLNAPDGDFELIFQKYVNGKWVTDPEICSPIYSFSVSKYER